jgi:glycosyltransferase involved in cell wall biosynthesis
MRLAWLSPLPPAPSGIADYSADVLALLAPQHEVEAFHDQEQVEAARLPGVSGIHRAQELLARQGARPYDAVVYQMGNAPAHAFLYDALSRLPGLLVLHDLVLHHARARMFLESPEARDYAREPWSTGRRAAAARSLDAYRAEVRYSHPAQADRLVDAQLGSVGDLLPYAYPLFRIPVEASRVTAVHNEFAAAAVRAEVPAARVVRIPMPAEPRAVEPAAARAVRARHGLRPDDFVVGAFGLLTREKRIDTVVRAVARCAPHLPRIRVLLVGPCPDATGLYTLLDRRGVAGMAVVTGRVALDELPAYMEAADVVAHLRYPTARETSAALLRVLAQGRPAVISDLEHQAHIPPGAVVRADPVDEEGDLTRAILRLAQRPQDGRALGERARAYVAREHAPVRTREAYEAALRETARAPQPPARPWPAHWPRPESGAAGRP